MPDNNKKISSMQLANSNLARDRIAQVYLGKYGSTEMQERTKNRLHWMASQVSGSHILDIGCSEGILALLLGREGLQVTGVDVNNEALDYARELIKGENDFVKSRLAFIHSDILQAQLEPESFDTIILGEVIEHLTKPELIIESAFKYLKKGGSVIITTPFGYHPDPDHRQTFTLSSFVKLFKPYCIPVELFIEDNYIRFAGVKQNPSEEDWSSFDNKILLLVTEQAMVAQQRFLRERAESFKNQSDKNKESLVNQQQRVSSLNDMVKVLQVERDEVKVKLQLDSEKLKFQLDVAKTEINKIQKDNSTAKNNIDKLESQNNQLEVKLHNLNIESKRLKVELEQSVKEKSKSEIEKKQLANVIEELEFKIDTASTQNYEITKQLQNRIEARNRAAKNYYNIKESFEALKNSLSFQLGYSLTQAISRPGINTIALPYRIVKIFFKGIKKRFKPEKKDLGIKVAPEANFFTPENKKYFQQEYSPDVNRRFYLLHSSLPWINNGYGIRSHGILTALKGLGIDVFGVTRLGFPVDFTKLKLTRAPELDKLDAVTYLRLPTSQYPYLKTPLGIYIQKYMEAIIQQSLKLKPALLHASSNYVNGIAAAHAAKALGIPSIYECRGLWEITRLSREPEWEFSDEFKKAVKLETEACNQATHVITITGALKDYIVKERGIPVEKISVVPNGVDGKRFTPRPRNKDLEAKYNLQNKTVIGFVGSFVGYEGLDLLIEATAILKKERDDFRVLLVGDGACYDDLIKQSTDAGLSEIINFTGRVPFHEAEEYYSLIDIAPFPRKGFLVCELVSPLKPFEAMAMEKVIVASNVAAQAEIINNGITGLLHEKDSATDLAKALNTLLEDKVLCNRLAIAARKWVLKERQWKHSANIIQGVHKSLLLEYNR